MITNLFTLSRKLLFLGEKIEGILEIVALQSQAWSQYERRYLLSSAASTNIAQAVAEHLPWLRGTPNKPTKIITVYLDTAGRRYQKQAEANKGTHATRIRIRQYQNTSPDDLNSDPPLCFLERKQCFQDVRMKHRVRISRDEIGKLLDGETAFSGDSPAASTIAKELENEPLRPVLVCSYERNTYGVDGRLRVTFDRKLTYYLPPTNVEIVPDSSDLEQLTIIAKGPPHILEIKHPAKDKVPAWLEQLVVPLAPCSDFSKFVHGMRQLRQTNISCDKLPG